MNLTCRVCGKEERNCVPVFGEDGKKQDIPIKARICLTLIISETDHLPKQICQTCLAKLDDTWEFYQLCKKAQALISKKFDLGLLSSNYKENVENFRINTVEDKLKLLSETNSISLGKIEISLVAESEPMKEAPPAVLAPVISASPDSMVGMLPAQTIMVSPPMYQPTTTSSALNQTPTPAASKSDVYPESLIHVNPTSKQIIYHQRNENSHGERQPKRVVPAPKRSVPVPKPMPPPTNNSPSLRRSLARESQANTASPAKRHLRQCKFFNKQFPNDIIDHHENLHLRKPFSTCLDCNKNFRTQLALDRHNCGVNEPIDLDADDEPICL